MEIRKVQVTDMMAAREARAFRQQELIRKYEKNVICFTLNIAGVSFHVECKVGQPRPLIDP